MTVTFPLVPPQVSSTLVSPSGIPQNDGCAVDAIAVTKSDVTVYAPVLRALYVGGTGNVRVRTVQGTTVTFTAVPAGFILPVMVDMVLSTSTTATGIVGLI